MVFGVRGFDTGMPVRSAGTLTPFMDDQRRRVSSTALASKQCPGALYRGLAVRIFWMGAAALPIFTRRPGDADETGNVRSPNIIARPS